MNTDYRQGQKVIATLEIEDKGQDFIELDILANGVLLGDSVIFENGRMQLLGIGTEDGMTYHDRKEIVAHKIGTLKLKGLHIYTKDTGTKDPLPWEARTLNYRVTKIKKAKNADRFIK